jgi:ABC-type molybdenum transport system ATPase subunit/photorepair protein PhrA
MLDLLQEDEKVRGIAARLDHLKRTVEEEEDSFAKASRSLLRSQEAQEIVQHISQAVQEKVHRRISEVVSSCLSTVFEDPYEFKINFERKRGKTEADLRFVRRGLDVSPLNACGGGMVDVAAFALRVSCLMLHRPRLSKVVVIDEAFRFVSAQYRENVRAMMEGLSEDLGIQIIQVTHISELETGTVVEL